MIPRPRTPSPPADILIARAVEGWLHHPVGVPPQEVSVLKEPRRKSTVLRLHGAGPDGEPVIAKRCPTEVAQVERTVYEQLLPRLPVTSLQLYGVSAEQEGFTWLFVEDAGDAEWSPGLPHHRALATEWLAAAHVAGLDLVESVDLPLRDTDYYLQLLRSAKSVLELALQNNAIDADGQGLLRELVSGCAAFETRWDDVEKLWSRFPRTLTLPGFGKKNVRVNDRAGTARFLPFDFESAGWGVPAAELAQIDLDRYVSATVSVSIPHRIDLERLAAIGSGLWSIKSISGEVAPLTSQQPSRAMRKLVFYARQISAALTILEPRRSGARYG